RDPADRLVLERVPKQGRERGAVRVDVRRIPQHRRPEVARLELRIEGLDRHRVQERAPRGVFQKPRQRRAFSRLVPEAHRLDERPRSGKTSSIAEERGGTMPYWDSVWNCSGSATCAAAAKTAARAVVFRATSTKSSCVSSVSSVTGTGSKGFRAVSHPVVATMAASRGKSARHLVRQPPLRDILLTFVKEYETGQSRFGTSVRTRASRP